MSIFTIGSALSSGITIYSRANQIKDVVNDIGGWLRSKSPEEEKRVRSNLEKLGRRLDALSQPLQFCMSWCQDKGSCISDSVYQAKRIQGEIDDFIQNLKGITKVSDHDKVYEMINEHIRELDFAFNSLNLSLNVIIASRTSIPNGSSVVPQSGSGEFKISPSSLLCASSRIRDMYEIGGDVCIASGLYLTRKTVQNERLTPGPWKKVSSSAFLNVVHNYRECKYYIRISNPPLGLDSPVTGFKTEFVLSQDLNFKLGNPSSFAIDIDDKNVTHTILQWTAPTDKTKRHFISHAFMLSPQFLETKDLRPLDVAYTIQLCTFENLNFSIMKKRRSSPFHLSSSDEELKILFQSLNPENVSSMGNFSFSNPENFSSKESGRNLSTSYGDALEETVTNE